MLVQFFFLHFHKMGCSLLSQSAFKENQIDLNTNLFNKFITTIRLKASISILAGIQPYATNVE